MVNNILFINGVPKIHKGAGLFSIQLDEDIKNLSDVGCLYVSNRIMVGKYVKRNSFVKASIALIKHIYFRIRFYFLLYSGWIKKPKIVIILHQQYVGLRLCQDIIRKRSLGTFIYLLDSGFFCIKSYNHLIDDNDECIKCLGGKFENIDLMGCKSFPISDKNFSKFLVNLRKYASNNQVSFLTQNRKQSNLVKLHFGKNVEVKTIGIWTTSLPEIDLIGKERENIIPKNYVLFHGAPLSAKGVNYTMQLAIECPQINFVFPFDKSQINNKNIPINCDFLPSTWDTGLKDMTKNAKFVLVPSLWSAPIESALIKSIMLARAVCVVDIENAFSSEISDDVIIKLSSNISKAAMQLQDAYNNNWTIDNDTLMLWAKKYSDQNKYFINNIYNYCLKV